MTTLPFVILNKHSLELFTCLDPVLNGYSILCGHGGETLAARADSLARPIGGKLWPRCQERDIITGGGGAVLPCPGHLDQHRHGLQAAN